MRTKNERMNLYITFYFFLETKKQKKICKSNKWIHEKLKMRENKKNISINFIILYYVYFFLLFINIKVYIL